VGFVEDDERIKMTVLFYVYGGRSLLQMKREEGFVVVCEGEEKNGGTGTERNKERVR
jgi:hypothetical protein